MWWQRAALVVFGALAVAIPARSAAEGATGRSTAVARSATYPTPKPSTSVAVTFDESAARLPQAQIREAIARELGGAPERTVVAAARELSIGVDASELIVRFSAPDGRSERRVAIPNDARQIPELLSLIAGNLARDQRVFVASTSANAAPVAVPPHDASMATGTGSPARATPLPFRRHWVGLSVAQDFTYGPDARVCDLASADSTYSCFLAGTSEPYRPSETSGARSVEHGFSVATTRLLASYDYALTPRFTLGGRFGVAFRGGPPGWATDDDGVRGAPFFPLHFEARATWWFAPLTNERVRAFLGAGGGVMQIDAKQHYLVNCPNSGYSSEDACALPPRPGAPASTPVNLDVWRKVGRGFFSARMGTEIRIWDELGVELDVNLIATLPAFGFALEPSAGVVYGL
jgi:hypothetical protein